MQNLLNNLKDLLKKDERFVSDGELLKNRIIEIALKDDEKLLELVLSNKRLKDHFFTEIKGKLIFKKDAFLRFVNNKDFLPDSYTSFKNKIGLTYDDEYFSEKKDVVLSFPYKDCILEGGQTKEETAGNRPEIFWNETLAPDEVDRLLEPKVLTNFKKIIGKKEHKATEIKSTDNLIIKGNNLLALHSLKKRFTEKVKLIYIDPPYNTGGDSFNYNDRFNHSSWLTFMKNRLEVARDLLREDGVIFVHIDYLEQAYLKVLMDEVFGRSNFIQIISMKTATPAGFKVVNPGPVNVTEFLIMFAKNRDKYVHKRGYVEDTYQKDYRSVILNKNEDPKKWKIISIKDAALKEAGFENEKEFLQKYGKEVGNILLEKRIIEFANKNADRVFATYGPHKPSKVLSDLIKKSEENKDKIIHSEREDNTDYYLLNGRLLAFYSNKLQDLDGRKVPTQLLTDFWSDLSWDSLSLEGGVTLKNGKKPERLLKRIIELTTEKGDIVLDFFVGSGTTCAVAHKMNRQYIGIEQIDYEKNDVLARLKNVIEGDPTGISKSVTWTGGGSVIYCELMEWNQKFVNHIQSAKTNEEIKKIWNEMKEKSFLSYNLNLKEFDKNASDFVDLSLDDQKKFLFEVLDKNQLYVNYSEINDKSFAISKEDKDLNKKFYGEITL